VTALLLEPYYHFLVYLRIYGIRVYLGAADLSQSQMYPTDVERFDLLACFLSQRRVRPWRGYRYILDSSKIFR
jgi:hypothetical protein